MALAGQDVEWTSKLQSITAQMLQEVCFVRQCVESGSVQLGIKH